MHNEILEYRLQQVEDALKSVQEIGNSIARDQMKFTVDHQRLDQLEIQIEGAFKRIDEIRQELPMFRHMSDRLNQILKGLLGAFVTALGLALVFVAKEGGLG